MSTLTVKDFSYGGPSGIFKVTLFAELAGPTISQIKKGGKSFQMTVTVFAEVEATDPTNSSVSTVWSQSANDPPPRAIQEVAINPHSGPPLQWTNRKLNDTRISKNIALYIGSPNVGTMTTVARFQSDTGRVISIWGKFEWEGFFYRGTDIPAGGIIVNVNTSNLEWNFSGVKVPR